MFGQLAVQDRGADVVPHDDGLVHAFGHDHLRPGFGQPAQHPRDLFRAGIPRRGLRLAGGFGAGGAFDGAIDQRIVAPGLVIAGTDSRQMSELTPNVYRFVPVRAKPEDLARFHGTNERIGVDNYAEVIRFFHRLISVSAIDWGRFCRSGDGRPGRCFYSKRGTMPDPVWR